MWTKDEVAIYEELVTQNLSPTVIAEKIGKTRSAVSSRMSREMDKRRKADPEYVKPETVKRGRPAGSKSINKEKVIKAKDDKPKKQKTHKAPVLLTKHREWPIDRIGPNGCRWPIGDDPRHPGFAFCGERAGDSSPYCPVHTRQAFTSYPRSQ